MEDGVEANEDTIKAITNIKVAEWRGFTPSKK